MELAIYIVGLIALAALAGAALALRQAWVWKARALAAEHAQDKAEALASQRESELHQRLADREKDLKALQEANKHQFLELSNQLLKDHHQRAESVRKQSEEATRKHSAQLMEQFETVVKSVSRLGGQVAEAKSDFELIKRGLLSPSGAGSLAEISLENLLKASGLLPGEDFHMQYTTTGESGRTIKPDAVVALPAGQILAIDSKASKFFLDLAQAGSPDEEAALRRQLVQRMQKHIRDLQSRDYRAGLSEKKEVAHVTILMFLPSDSAVETLQALDPELFRTAAASHIFVAGPSGLRAILSQARQFIASERQAENHARILEEVQKLVGNITKVYDDARRMGGNLKNALGNYDALAATFNSQFFTRMRNLEKLGVSPKGNKSLPSRLERYQIAATGHLIEAETSEEEPPKLSKKQDEAA